MPLVENSAYVPAAKPKAKPEGQPTAAQSKAATEAPAPEKPKRLFLRVPDRESREFLKAVNIIDIFEGYTQVVFYRMDEKSYFTYSSGITVSPTVLAELKSILGDGNVVFK